MIARSGPALAQNPDHGRYRLCRRLAKGAMAEEHLAVLRGESGFEKFVVIKFLFGGLHHQQRLSLEMLADEARLAARLNHPNIIQVLDFGTMDGRPFLAMELLPGQDLLRIAWQARALGVLLPVDLVGRIAADMLAGLHHAHTCSEPILHRAVSPQNVIVSYAGGVKLIDFGVATRTVAESSVLTLFGHWKSKCPYQSPEQTRHDSLDARTDVFSTGVVLWELLTGKRLFHRQSEFATMRAVCNDDVPPPSAVNPLVPAELDAITCHALARERDQRFSSADSMRAALEELLWKQQWRADGVGLRALMASLFPGAEEVDAQLRQLEADAKDDGAAAPFDDEPTQRERTPFDSGARAPSADDEPTHLVAVPAASLRPPPQRREQATAAPGWTREDRGRRVVLLLPVLLCLLLIGLFVALVVQH